MISSFLLGAGSRRSHTAADVAADRVFNMGVFSKTVDSVFEDYMRVEDNGTVIVTQQWCRHIGDNTSCSQYLIGRKTGPNPPSHKHKH